MTDISQQKRDQHAQITYSRECPLCPVTATVYASILRRLDKDTWSVSC